MSRLSLRAAGVLLVGALSLPSTAAGADARFDVEAEPVWSVADQTPIAPPAPSGWNEVASFVDAYWFYPLDDFFAMRRASPALDVNALDEVPASSWFTPGKTGLPPWLAGSRSLAAPLSPILAGRPPHSGPLAVLAARLEGESPYLLVRDSLGVRFRLEFDAPEAPELRTGAAVIAGRLLHAAGYHVLESTIATLQPARLVLAPEAAEIGRHGGRRALSAERLDDFLARRPQATAALAPGAGEVRVAASRIPEGVILGGFSPRGRRADDPSDLIPHEARRSLRGLNPLAAWLDHAALQQDATLDLYLQPDNYVRHCLTGLTLTLGNARNSAVDGAGRFYGLHAFHPRLLEPLTWRPELLFAPFAAMDWADAFWGVRLLLSFSDAEIASVVAAGRYSDPQVTEYVTGALQERRDRIGRAWLERINAIDRFAVRQPAPGRWSLQGTDLGVLHGLRQPEDVYYLMTMRLPETGETLGYQSRPGGQIEFDLTPFVPAAWSHRLDPGRYAIADITSWDHTGRSLTGTTRVHLYFDRASGPRVAGIIRD